jgi:hypothetical protein
MDKSISGRPSANIKREERPSIPKTKRGAQIKRFIPSMFATLRQKWLEYRSSLNLDSGDNDAFIQHGRILSPTGDSRRRSNSMNTPLHTVDYTQLNSQMLSLPGELRNHIYDYLIPPASVGSESVLGVPHPWILEKSYFAYARISPPLPEFLKSESVPCFGGRGQLWEEYTDRYSTAASFTIEGRFDLDVSTKSHCLEIPDRNGVVQKCNVREASLVERCVDEKMIPNLIQRDSKRSRVEVVVQQKEGSSAALSDLELWLPKIRTCTLILRVSGELLRLFSAQLSPDVSKEDVNVHLNAGKLADKAAPGIVELMEAIASIFRFSNALKTLEVILELDSHIVIKCRKFNVFRAEILNKWIGPLREVKTVNGVTIKCRGKKGWDGTQYGRVVSEIIEPSTKAKLLIPPVPHIPR